MWIAFMTPICIGAHETGYERDRMIVMPAGNITETILALERSVNVRKYCLVEANTRRKAMHKARLMFDHRSYAAYLVRNSLKKAKMV